jgi:serine O-acetyltransferase
MRSVQAVFLAPESFTAEQQGEKTMTKSVRPDVEGSCRTESRGRHAYRERLRASTRSIIDHAAREECYTHIDDAPMNARRSVAELIDGFREILFPGYFCEEKMDSVNLEYSLGQSVSGLFDLLVEQVAHVLRHDCIRYDQVCIECENRAYEVALEMIDALPAIREVLATDVKAAYDGDPAAKSHDEIIFSYPGIYAITVNRIAHRLHKLEVPLLPRIMTEYAHSITGIDIHPGASIGERFVIDHGTGVVIGETTRIGRNVRIYQGVTLGALSLPKDAGNRYRGRQRHPTIEDDVIVYSGATILGGDTVIGARSVIGGNVWLTESVPPETKVLIETPRLIYS